MRTVLILSVFGLSAVAVVCGAIYHDSEQPILQLLILAGIVVGLIDRQVKHIDITHTEKSIERKVDENTVLTKIVAESNPESNEKLLRRPK